MPADTLSMCDFFGAAFSIIATVTAAASLPTPIPEGIYTVLTMSLSVAVQVSRFSLFYYLIPSSIVITIMFCSWVTANLLIWPHFAISALF